MASNVTPTNTFQTQPGPLPLSQLDTNFSAITAALNAFQTYGNYLVDSSGAANTITVTTPAGTTFAYIAGVPIQIQVANTTTSSTVNINVNGLGNKPVVLPAGGALTAGQIVAGQIISVIYDGTSFRMISETSGAASFSQLNVGPATSGFSLIVSGSTSTGDITATGSRSSFLSASITTNSQVVLANTVTSYGLNTSWDGSNWRTGTDGGSNGGALILSGYNPGNLAFYTIPNTGATNQSISNSALNSANLRMVIASAGNVSISAPSSGSALTVTGPSASYSQLQLSIVGTAANGAGISFTDGEAGNRIWSMGSGFGSPGLFGIYDATGGALRMSIDTSGNINVPNGAGSLTPVYAGVPQNLQNNNYTLVLSDANKQLLHNTATPHTYTIPASASVPYPVGTCITIVNGGQAGGTLTLSITSDTIQFFPSGNTGSRTFAPYSQGTLNKVTSTVWVLTGVGIT